MSNVLDTVAGSYFAIWLLIGREGLEGAEIWCVRISRQEGYSPHNGCVLATAVAAPSALLFARDHLRQWELARA